MLGRMASFVDGCRVCAVGIACVMLGGCSSEDVDCTAGARVSLSVTVQHEGVSVCDAVVTATHVSSGHVYELGQINCT